MYLDHPDGRQGYELPGHRDQCDCPWCDSGSLHVYEPQLATAHVGVHLLISSVSDVKEPSLVS